MTLLDRKTVLLLGMAVLTVFVAYGAAIACPQDSKWTVADERKGKEILKEVMRDFDDLAEAKKRLDENPDDSVAQQVAKNALDNIEKMAQGAFKAELSAARLRSDKVAVRNMTKVRSKLLSIEEDAQNMLRDLAMGSLEKEADPGVAEDTYGREEALADIEGSYSGVFSSDFASVEADLRSAFAAQKDPDLSNSQEQKDRVAAIQNKLDEIMGDISVYSYSGRASKEDIDAAMGRVDQLARAASAI